MPKMRKGSIFMPQKDVIMKIQAKIFIIIGCCLALTACGKNSSTGANLPEGYQVKETARYFNMTECIKYAELQIEKKKAQKVSESDPNSKTHVISVNVQPDLVSPFPYSALYICNAQPHPNATLTIAVKPAT